MTNTKLIDDRLEVPLHERDLVTYREAQALGYGSERKLRELVVTGRLLDSVVRVGRSVRFDRRKLIEELRQRS